ncbi:MAG: DUF5060 domain-containing protein [Acidobacteriota bacterium]
MSAVVDVSKEHRSQRRPMVTVGRLIVATLLLGLASSGTVRMAHRDSAGPVTSIVPTAFPVTTNLANQLAASVAGRSSLTRGRAEAHKFGTHEIELAGNGSVSNPFDTVAFVTFTPPSGGAHAKTVEAFYDGGDTWRARVYVNEVGQWSWRSQSDTDTGLDNKSGRFTATRSSLSGLLKLNPANPRQWMTDNGRWFANVSDTGYRLFHGVDAPLWQSFIRDSAERGITSMRTASLGGWGGTPDISDYADHWVWNDPWAGGANPDYTRFELSKFQTTDERLIWSFDNYPDLYFQLILFGLKDYGTDNTGTEWFAIPKAARERTMRYMIARWSAFPNLFWLIVNDMHSNDGFPNNRAFARDVGQYFADHEPWRHLISSGPNRGVGFPFAGAEDRSWCSYIYIEDADAVGANQIQDYGFDSVPLHVFMGEDYYEQDHSHYVDPSFFFRWLQWSWLIEGGSANYCGRWGVIHPYTQTSRSDLEWFGIEGMEYTGEQLVGLDSMRFIARYFKDRKLDLGRFVPDDSLVSDLDGRTGRLRPLATRRDFKELIAYHPNAIASSYASAIDSARTARMRVDLTNFRGLYKATWYRPVDGVSKPGGTVKGGAPRDLMAPWIGSDVVLRLVKRS